MTSASELEPFSPSPQLGNTPGGRTPASPLHQLPAKLKAMKVRLGDGKNGEGDSWWVKNRWSKKYGLDKKYGKSCKIAVGARWLTWIFWGVFVGERRCLFLWSHCCLKRKLDPKKDPWKNGWLVDSSGWQPSCYYWLYNGTLRGPPPLQCQPSKK